MEAEGREIDICTTCRTAEATWRCLECIGRPMLCIGCSRIEHSRTPFHRVEQWTGTHWAPSWLISVGCEIHLGHNGDQCPNTGQWNPPDNPIPDDEEWVDEDEDGIPPAGSQNAFHPQAGAAILPPEDLPQVATVVDTSGVHKLVIRPCRCISNDDPDDIQLLKMGLFPTSFLRIKTVFTLRVLDAYRLDNLVCNTTAYQYYKRLRRLTSPAFPHTVPVSHPIV
jgi:CxC2 like cysteine cluster associated with KDZ transposases